MLRNKNFQKRMMFQCIFKSLQILITWQFKPICTQTINDKTTSSAHHYQEERRIRPWFPGSWSSGFTLIKSTFWLNVKNRKNQTTYSVNLSDGVWIIEFNVNRIYSRIRHNRKQSCVILNDRKHYFSSR